MLTLPVRALLSLLLLLTLGGCTMRSARPSPPVADDQGVTRQPSAVRRAPVEQASGATSVARTALEATATPDRALATATASVEATRRPTDSTIKRAEPAPTKPVQHTAKVRPRTAPVQKPVTLASARRGIQQTVNRYYEALDAKDVQLFRTTIVPGNPYWREVQEEQYALWLINYAEGDASARVRNVRPLGHGYYTGKIDLTLVFNRDEYGRATQDWVFRRVDGRWKLAEPTRRELGTLHSMHGTAITLEYYSWDAAQARRVMLLSETAYRTVSSRLAVRSRQRIRVRLLPAYEVSPGQAAGESVGYYRSATPNALFLRSPGSFGFGTYRPYGSPYDELAKTATHELTHLLADRRVPLGSLPDWMTEGLAEWVSGNPRPYEIRRALRADGLYSLPQLAAFERLTGVAGLAYAQSYEIVSYVIQTHGMNGYWRLARAHRDHGTVDRALRAALGVGQPEFEREWRKYLRGKYGTDPGR